MTAARILRDVTLADYRADELGGGPPNLSQSIASILLSQSPLHAHQAHPKLGGGTDDEPTPEQDMGTLIHRLVLGAGAPIVEVDADAWRSKEAKDQRDNARAAGAIPVLSHKLRIADIVARKIDQRLKEQGVELFGDSEVMVAWEENGVACKGILDHVVALSSALMGHREPIVADATIYDLKTTTNANPAVFARRVVDCGYDVQAAAYVSAVEHLYPAAAGRVEYLMLVAELRAPYALTVCKLGGALKQLGEERWKRAVATWQRCLEEDSWPGYGDGVQVLEAAPWQVAQLEMEALNG